MKKETVVKTSSSRSIQDWLAICTHAYVIQRAYDFELCPNGRVDLVDALQKVDHENADPVWSVQIVFNPGDTLYVAEEVFVRRFVSPEQVIEANPDDETPPPEDIMLVYGVTFNGVAIVATPLHYETATGNHPLDGFNLTHGVETATRKSKPV